jgi:hypothetical protein
MRSMTPRHHRYCVRLLLAGLLAGAAAYAEASSTSLTINATVVEVQCTAEQRLRIRACAPAQENYTIEAPKAVVSVRTGAAAEDSPVPQFEIRPDFGRQVVIKTVLY